jgi:hypothetical protein
MIAAGVGGEFGINRNQCDGVPGSQQQGYEPSRSAYEKDVAIVFRNVDRGLQHQDAKGDPRNPGYEADDTKHGKYAENNATRIILFVEIVNGRSKLSRDQPTPSKKFQHTYPKADVHNTGNPLHSVNSHVHFLAERFDSR